jgi:hypothetical protein
MWPGPGGQPVPGSCISTITKRPSHSRHHHDSADHGATLRRGDLQEPQHTSYAPRHGDMMSQISQRQANRVPGVRSSRLGAYGFTLEGLEDAEAWLVEAPGDWPSVLVRQEKGQAQSRTRLGPESAEVAMLGGRLLRMQRDPAEVTYLGPSPLTVAEMIHPFLSPAASILAEWAGWIPLHSGGFAVGDRAWLITADREGGKSTTLAALSETGVPIVADDMVVLKEGRALAGPRSLDLRDPGGFQEVEDLGVVGQRRRWRMRLPPIAAEVPVAGVIKLEWSASESVRSIPVEERPNILIPSASMPIGPKGLLQIFSLPTLVVSRPKGELTETVRLVREAIAGRVDA